jgi:tripartite-type tricarboxylate transporter receptor subunit TctC
LGLAAPAGTPAAIVNNIAADVAKVMKDKEVLDKFVDPYGYDVIADTPKQFEAFLAQDKLSAGKRIKDLGVKLD